MSDKGTRAEQELATALYDRDWGVLRGPASGGATQRECPDLLVGDGEVRYAFEVKASSRDRAVYIESREVRDLQYFAERLDARARIGVRFDYTPWAFFAPSDLHVTPSGKNYRVRHSDVARLDPIVLQDGVTSIDDL